MYFHINKKKHIYFASASKNGFTLLELLLVLIIIGLSSTVIFLSITSGFFRSEERKFIEFFNSGLLRAKSESLCNGGAVWFIIDSENREVRWNKKDKEEIPETIQIEANGLEVLGDGIFGIMFFPDGSSTGGEIDIKKDSIVIEKFRISRLFGGITRE